MSARDRMGRVRRCVLSVFGAVAASVCSPVGAQPELLGIWAYVGDPAASYPVATRGPVTVEPRDVDAFGMQIDPISSSFEMGADGWEFRADAFRGTAQPGYAAGSAIANNGNPGGALYAVVGGVDNDDIEGMSAGFARSFEATAGDAVRIAFDYRFVHDFEHENNEFAEALVSLNGELIGGGADGAFARFEGGGDSGWQRFEVVRPIGVTGVQEIVVGVYSNLKTFNDETTEITIDNVVIASADGSGGGGSGVGGGPSIDENLLSFRFAFDGPIEAIRAVEAENGRIAHVAFAPGDSEVVVTLLGVQNGTYPAVTLVDVAAGGRVLPRARAWIGLHEGDFNGDGVWNAPDINLFVMHFLARDARADGNLDGVFNAGDINWFVSSFTNPVRVAPVAPDAFAAADADFAAIDAWSSFTAFSFRDELLDESEIVVTAAADDGALIPARNIEIVSVAPEGAAEAGGERAVRFRGASGASGTTPLRITIDDGMMPTELVLVATVGADTAPTARMASTGFVGVAPLTITFDASGSIDEQGNIASYAWSFDGESAAGVRVTHTFASPGEHTATLTVTDESGNTSTAEQVITVAAAAFDATSDGASGISEAEAGRFLKQAAFGHDEDAIAFIVANGYEAWIDAQFDAAPNYIMDNIRRDPAVTPGWENDFDEIWSNFGMFGADQLRQRMAWALIQIIVLNDFIPGENAAAYTYDTYIKHALGDVSRGASGNYRELLDEITYSAHMGRFLTYEGNKKANLITGSAPDENYAREVMQLFSIGVWQLNPDGTRVVDPFGDFAPTYDTFDITQFARVFTGLDRGESPFEDVSSQATPMRLAVGDHEFGDKLLLVYPGSVPEGGYIPFAEASEANLVMDIDAALDNVFYHPSCPPFIAEALIKRFTVSNPSRAYVGRVADAFAGAGPYGSGVRGDLRATIKAILLDDEARNPAYRSNPMYGKAREPLLLLLAAAKGVGQVNSPEEVYPWQTDLDVRGSNWQAGSSQGFMQSPSVFNFYQPNFVPAGTPMAPLGMTAPELQIYTESTAVATLNYIRDRVVSRGDRWDAALYGRLAAVQEDAELLVDELDRVLNASGTSGDIKDLIVSALGAIDGEQDRIRATAYLLLASPDYRVLR